MLKKVLVALITLQLLDLLTTIIGLHTLGLGIEAELNSLARRFMYSLGIIWGLVIKTAIVDIPLMFLMYFVAIILQKKAYNLTPTRIRILKHADKLRIKSARIGMPLLLILAATVFVVASNTIKILTIIK